MTAAVAVTPAGVVTPDASDPPPESRSNAAGGGAKTAAAIAVAPPGVAAADGSDPPPATTNQANLFDPVYLAAVQLVAKHDYGRALSLLGALVQHNPANVDAWNYMSYAFWRLGRFEDAQLAYAQGQQAARSNQLRTD